MSAQGATAEIHPVFVFEVALGIDLDRAEGLLGRGSARQLFRHRGRVTSVFHYRPAPLRVSQECSAIQVDGWATKPMVDLVLYDFGAASVAYQVPVPGGLEELHAASTSLRRTTILREDARNRVEALLGSFPKAVQKPRVAELTEDYTIVGMSRAPGEQDALEFCQTNAKRIAEILRPDGGAPSEEEVRNATEVQISFGPSDATIVDWDAAFVLDPEPEEVRAVLEFANVQLLEMRWLDLQLDGAIDRSYHLLARRKSWRPLLSHGLRADLNQVAELQLESAVMLERVSNALKVFGEEYLARIYRLAARRFRLEELDATISRKLVTIESIYQKLSDRADSRRMEVLEWVVILLIASEILLSLLKH